MSIVLEVLLELTTIEGGWNALFMEKKDEAINTSACRCPAQLYLWLDTY